MNSKQSKKLRKQYKKSLKRQSSINTKKKLFLVSHAREI